MKRHNELEGAFNRVNEDLLVVDVDIELSLEGVMNEDAGLDVDVRVLTIPVGPVSDRNTIPTLGIDVAKTISHALNDTLYQHVRFLVQMMVVGVRVVETSDLHLGKERSVSQEHLLTRVEKRLALACNTPYHIVLLIMKYILIKMRL